MWPFVHINFAVLVGKSDVRPSNGLPPRDAIDVVVGEVHDGRLETYSDSSFGIMKHSSISVLVPGIKSHYDIELCIIQYDIPDYFL